MDIAVDEASIRSMVDAFHTCQNECLSIQLAVDSARERLGAHWRSDQAAPVFGEALNQWLAGFQRVRRGLDTLDHQMREYTRLTASTEEANVSDAGRWPTS